MANFRRQEEKTVRLTQRELRTFGIAKYFPETNSRINSMSFFKDGKHLITASDDDSISLYDTEQGKKTMTLNSKKYGCSKITFTNQNTRVLYASTKENDAIRYQSVAENKYLEYFAGHTDKVNSVSMSPVDDFFLTSSKDKTVRLWDLRTRNCQGVIKTDGRNKKAYPPISTCDSEGLIFAIAFKESPRSGVIKLYDKSNYDNGPFSDIAINEQTIYDFTSLEFSPDGKLLLLCTNGMEVYVVDAFDGLIKKRIKNIQNIKGEPIQAGFSPDSKHIYVCGSDGKIDWYSCGEGANFSMLFSWDTASQQQTSNQSISAAKFNPAYCLFASAGHSLNLWVPDVEQL